MARLKTSLVFETAFSTYTADEVIGEGGAGRVYAAQAADGSQVAVKLLAEERASKEKRGRFKNEIAFLAKNKHRNIVTVIDYGLIRTSNASGPFYVMPRYGCSLRDLMRQGIAPDKAFPFFAQLLDGVEAAHLQSVVHRDLKPENVLFNRETDTLAVADFGIARFTEDLLATMVETAPTQRLANFLYASPEQRSQGQSIEKTADIYSLGLLLNELFTGVVPHGTDYKQIGSVLPALAYLDQLVAQMIRQAPRERPESIGELKSRIQQYQAEAVSLQRLSEISGTVVPTTLVDDPLTITPVKIVAFDWNGRILTLTLDKAVSQPWVEALNNMGSYSSAWNCGPESFSFLGNLAKVNADESQIQLIIDNFKAWMPKVTSTLKYRLEQAAQRADSELREKLRREKEAEEKRLRVLRDIKI